VKQRTVKQVRILQSRCSQRHALRHLAGCHQAPQRNEQLARQGRDHRLAGLASGVCCPAYAAGGMGALAALSARRNTGAIKLPQQMR
jgi:hypothetical protein